MKIKANLFQYGAFIFRTDKLTNELKVSLACLAQSSLFLRITNKTKSLETFGAWFYGWWDWHVEQRAQINLQRKNELLEKAHQGDTYIDPWINQVEVLTKLKKKDFPKLFVTWEALKKSKSQKCDSEIKKKARFAFIAEWRALTGKTPKWIDQSELTFDEKAVAYLCRAHSRKAGSKSNALTWWLAINWTKYELFLKNPKELAECYFEKTGVKISSSAIKQARYLAELKSRLKRGKKPSIQPSK